MKTRLIIIAAFAALCLNLFFMEKSLSQEYIATVFSFGHGAGSINAGLTRYLAAFDGTTNATDIYKIVIPCAGTLKNLYWRAQTSTLTANGNNITVFKNGTATSIVATWNTTATSGNDLVNIVPVVAGDIISVRIKLPTGGGNIQRPTISLELLVPGTVGSQWTTSDSDIYFNSGNVGIGTNIPGEMLTVDGFIESTTGGFKFPDGSIQNTSAISGSGGFNALNAADDDPVNALFVDDDGKVGIGTISPQQTLTLSQSSNSATEMTTPIGVTATVISGGNLGLGLHYFKIVAEDGSGGLTVGSAEVSCNIANTNNAACQLNWLLVQGAKSYRIYKGTAPGGQNMYKTSTTNSYLFTTESGAIFPEYIPPVTTAYVNKFSAAGNSWLLGGNVGIGTSSPTSILDVNGDVRTKDLKIFGDSQGERYIRIGNVQICWGTFSTENNGGQNIIATIPFPKAYYGGISVQLTMHDPDNTGYRKGIVLKGVHTDRFEVWSPTGTGTTYYFDWFAIGLYR